MTFLERLHPQTMSRRNPRWLAPVCALMIMLAVVVPRPTEVSGHAFLAGSTPAANSVLLTAPPEFSLRFTEPLETSYSKATLFDQTGEPVENAPFRFGEDGYSMIVSLPTGLANGTYSVLWRTLSQADGHTAEGYVAFTIGTDANVTSIVPPTSDQVSTGAPEILRAVSRWFALMTLAMVVAIWPMWVLVLRPAISPAWQAGPKLARRARSFAIVALVLALVADIVALLVQAFATIAEGGYIGSVITTVTQTRYGTLWLVRIGLLLVWAAAMLGVSWWWPRRTRIATVAVFVVSALLPIPFSMLAHAAAQTVGRATAIAFDVIHLLGASVWIGGVLALLFVLTPTLNDLTPPGRKVVLSIALPRFSVMALAAWAVMVITGLYNGWLQVGSLAALTQTPYGQTLMIKFALLVPLLALGAFNLLVVTRKIKRANTEEAGTGWSSNLVTALAAEAVLVTLLLGVVGMMIGQAPAREVYAQTAGKTVIALEANGQEGRLLITPGAVGPNHYRLELGSGHEAHLRNPVGTVATLRFELPSSNTGQVDLVLAPALGGAFEGHGSQLSIAGDWAITVIVTSPAQPDWNVTSNVPISIDPPESTLPDPAPAFGPVGVLGLLLGILGIAGVVLGTAMTSSVMRKEAIGLSAVAIVIGGLVLFQSQLPVQAAAPVPGVLAERPDPEMVARGELLFATNCAACHGARGQGDGPLSAEGLLSAANLTVSHARLHSDADLANWIRNGIPGTQMQGFGDRLSDQEVADLVAYIRDLQFDALRTLDAPGAEVCTIEPVTLDEIAENATAGVSQPPASPVGGVPASDADKAAIRETVRMLVGCSNAGDTLRRLALYSDNRVRYAYPEGPTAALKAVSENPLPVPQAERVALLDVSDVRTLDDGRIAARVVIDNPAFHTHGPATPGASTQQEAALLVFVQENGMWKIDDVAR